MSFMPLIILILAHLLIMITTGTWFQGPRFALIMDLLEKAGLRWRKEETSLRCVLG